MILHTVNKSPSTQSTLKECLFAASNNDNILLIEDGVYGSTIAFRALLKEGLHYFVLQEDLDARGIAIDQLAPEWTAISYTGFVELTETADTVCSWF